jgi:hypothetical protein
MEALFKPLPASALVAGRHVIIAPSAPLGVILKNAKLLQKARDQGALKTLIDLFACQQATVIEVRCFIF